MVGALLALLLAVLLQQAADGISVEPAAAERAGALSTTAAGNHSGVHVGLLAHKRRHRHHKLHKGHHRRQQRHGLRERIASHRRLRHHKKKVQRATKRRGAGEPWVPKLIDVIDSFRAEKCAHMFGKHGKLFPSFEPCRRFMEDICRPGSDLEMDGDKNERTSGKGFCKAFFPDDDKDKAGDSDGDGTMDELDAFPNDPEEISDADGDGVGDNADLDSDNDGVNDDEDAFPHDPKEHLDTDGDGIGDNEDPDDDDDGYPDGEDAFRKDHREHQDTDGDGIGDNADEDDDNDGHPDHKDAFPKDSMEHLDSDGDGIGNNKDSDDDNDGVPDAEDAFPMDSSRAKHVGKASPNDDTDGDGVPDHKDAFPNDPTEHEDTDGDGVGDNADEDDDDDGHLDEDDAFPKDPSKWNHEDGSTLRGRRYHMSEDKGAKEQGFTGDKVEHDDQKTSIDGFANEYGPGSGGLRDGAIRRICQHDFSVTNDWCARHGYLQPSAASPGAPLSGAGLLVILAVSLSAALSVPAALAL